MLVLFTDSDCDFTLETAKEYGYNLIIMPYTIAGKDIYPYVDYEEFDYKSYYNQLRSGIIPTTSALNPNAYVEYFEPVFARGDDILYVHFSEKMSGTFNSMRIALEELKEKYPERKFYEIDTKAITIGAYNVCCAVSKLYKEGKTIDEILEWSKTEIDKFAVYFFAEDLRFFSRSGRVSGLAAMMGSMIGLRPIMNMNSEGVMCTVGKEKGRLRAIKRLLEYVDELGVDIKNHKIVIAHADIDEACDAVIASLKEKYGEDLDIDRLNVNPTIGAHCGPSTLGISFYAKHR